MIVWKHKKDAMFAILVTKQLDHWIDFKLLAVATEMDGDDHYDREGTSGCEDLTRDPNEAASIGAGFIKWDGCMEVQISEHFCGESDLKEFMGCLSSIYDMAEQFMTKFNKELARCRSEQT